MRGSCIFKFAAAVDVSLTPFPELFPTSADSLFSAMAATAVLRLHASVGARENVVNVRNFVGKPCSAAYLGRCVRTVLSRAIDSKSLVTVSWPCGSTRCLNISTNELKNTSISRRNGQKRSRISLLVKLGVANAAF